MSYRWDGGEQQRRRRMETGRYGEIRQGSMRGVDSCNDMKELRRKEEVGGYKSKTGTESPEI